MGFSTMVEDALSSIWRKLDELFARIQKLEAYESKTLSLSRVSSAVSYVMLSSDVYIGITNTAAPRAVTLVNANTQVSGRIVIVKDESGGAAAQNITVTPAAGTIDGAANKVINTAWGFLRCITDGTNWMTWIIAFVVSAYMLESLLYR